MNQRKAPRPQSKKARINPFYVVLILAGIAFVVTACAYGVMAVRHLHGQVPADDPTGFLAFMDHQGTTLLISELIVLAVATFAAIGTDRYWTGEA